MAIKLAVSTIFSIFVILITIILFPQNSFGHIQEDDLLEPLTLVRSAAFIGTEHAWLITTSGNLLFTDNAGVSWTSMRRRPAGDFGCISFINPRQGWTVGTGGVIWRTSDGGKTWATISKIEYPKVGLVADQIKFVDESNGWVIAPLHYIWRTTDGGKNWQLYSTLSDKHRAEIIRGFFISPSLGWVACNGGVILTTKDGGKNWSASSVETTSGLIYDVFFIDKKIGWITGFPDFGIYRTSDAGEIWKLQLPFKSLNETPVVSALSFINQNEGWAVGQDKWADKIEHHGLILHTTNGGETWETVHIKENDTIYSWVYFADSVHGWVIDHHNVYRTNNKGVNWLRMLKLAL